MKYALVDNGGQKSITALIDGELYTATSDHPRWGEIVNGVAHDKATAEMFSLEKAIEQYVRLSDRISVAGGTIYFDGDPINDTVTNKIIDLYNNGDDFISVVEFMERLYTNPSEDVRNDQLFQWLEVGGLTLTEDGLIVGYKGVARHRDGGFESISRGEAFVNGVLHIGAIPQRLGDVVEMPRSAVDDDPNNACSTGLHVGTFEYAQDFGQGIVLAVLIDPRDVVSVPSLEVSKMRVCRYSVLCVVQEQIADDLSEESHETEYVQWYESEWLDSASWSPLTNKLNVTLVSGSDYTYHSVPRIVWEEFSCSESPGRYLNENIKNTFEWGGVVA